MSSTKREFYYVIRDNDRKLFHLWGPMQHCSVWDDKVMEAQQAGRDMRSQSVEIKSVEQTRHWFYAEGFTEVQTPYDVLS